MKLSQTNNKKWLYLLLAFLLPFVGMVVVMIAAGCTPFGNSSMLYSDMWHQYFPFFKAFREALRSGDSLLYSWNVGMGLDYLGLISYYLASPLNLLSVLLPESWVLPYFSMLVPIKLGLAGLFFAIFLNRSFGREDLSLPLFGGFYALCAWALGYQWNVMWLDTFALLPLVALGTIALLRDKKFILYTLTLFLSIYANYYVGLFTCIFVLLLFICYQICCCKSFKRFFSDLCRIAVFSVLAIGMTAILELPALAALQTTQSSVNSFPEGFAMNIVSSADTAAAKEAWKAYTAAKEAGNGDLIALWFTAIKESIPPILQGMRQVAGNMGGGLEPTFKEGLPNLYCGVGTIILAFLYLTSGQIKLREKLCCAFLLIFFMLSFLIRQLDYIWHGFHFTNMIPYRFSFLFSFVMLYMAYRAYLMRYRFQTWQFICAGLFALSVLLCAENYKDTTYLLYNGIFFVLYLAIFFLSRVNSLSRNERNSKALRRAAFTRRVCRNISTVALAAVMLVELIINLVNFGVTFSYTNIPNYPKGTTYTESMIRYMKEDDDLFYRTEVTHTQTLNDGALNGYYGISTFTSSANVSVTKFMKALGFGAKETYNRYSYEESSPVANLFLNLKYMLERDGRVEENPYFDEVLNYDSVYLLENNAYLPLGFLTEKELADLDFGNSTADFAFQNRLFTAATGIEDAVWTLLPESALTIEPNGTVITSQSSSGYVAYDNDSSQTTLEYHYNITDSGFLCVDLSMNKKNSFTVWKNGTQLYSESMSLDQILSVCQVEPGDEIEINITCKADTTGTVNIKAALLNESLFRIGYDFLAASTLDLTEFSNTYVEGTINCNRDGLLYTSIPQNGTNWTATVDGEEAEIILVGDCMVALELTEGQHTIAFRYHNNAFTLGCVVSAVCLLIFVGIILAVYQPWKRKYAGKFSK